MHDARAITELLMACLPPPGARPLDRLRAATTAITHWEPALAAATIHRLCPLLFHRLRATNLLDALPAATRQHLEQLYLAAAVRSARLQEELKHVLALFASLGIDALPLRGPLLPDQLNFDPPTRQSDDLDLLLHRHDLSRARETLLAAGYAPLHAPASPAAEAHTIRIGGAHVLQRPGINYQVDLIWTLTPRYFISPLTLADLSPHRDAHALRREALLVTLCIHGTKHLWSRHAWTHDVVALLATPDTIDWEAAWAHAQRLGGARMLLLGIAWAARASGLPLPGALASRVARDGNVARLCDNLAARFDADATWQPADDFTKARLHLLAQPSVPARLRYLAWRAFTPSPNDWRGLKLPDPLFPLYAALRPFRLATRWLRQ